MQRRSSPKIGTTDVIELVKLGNETSVASSLVFTFRRESLRALWSRALTQRSKVNFFVLFSHNTWSPWQMPREAALKARERLRACVTEPHVEDTELEGKRPHIDEDGDYKQRASSSAMSVTRRHRCGVCVGCNATNCGRCVYCLDMPQFGGTGNLRKSCIERTCVEITKENERLAEARRVEREAERERIERWGSARRAGTRVPLGNSTGAAAAVAKHTGFMPGTNARLPSVRLEASIDSGWGQFDFLPGMRVEVNIPKEEYELGLMAGRVVDPYSEQPPPSQSRSSPRKSSPHHAAVVERAVKAGKVCVEFDELLSEVSEAHATAKVPLREFIEPQRLRLLPPNAFPKGAACLLRPGDLVDLYYQDGWWEVVIQAVEEPAASNGLKRGQRGKQHRGKARKSATAAVAAGDGGDAVAGDGGGAHDGGGAPEAAAGKRTAQTRFVNSDMDAKGATPEDEDTRAAKLKKKSNRARLFHVKAVLYNATHQVSEERLRPRWLWSHERRVWRYELACGHGCVPLEGNGRPSFVFAGGAPRSWNPHYAPIATPA